jgi:hypothetical protein
MTGMHLVQILLGEKEAGGKKKMTTQANSP